MAAERQQILGVEPFAKSEPTSGSPFRCAGFPINLRGVMTILPRPSVSPLYSFCTISTHRVVSFSAALRSIIAWLSGRQPKPSKSEVQFEQRIVDLLAVELEENDGTSPSPAETSLKPIMPKRPRRRDVGLWWAGAFN
jgi:hypothetical protein